MNLEIQDFKEPLTSNDSKSYSHRSPGQDLTIKTRRGDQFRALLIVFCLMIACGHTNAWLFFSKYMQTYLYFQMAEYTASPRVELALYFSMLVVTGLFMPLATNLMFKMPIKAVLCLACVCILTGSISFIVCSNVWTFIVMQSTFTAIGTSLFQLTCLLLAWEWFSPERRGLMSGVVVAFKSLAVALVIAFQIGMIEYKNLVPIEELQVEDADIDIFPQQVAMKMILLYFFICGLQGIVTATVLAFAQRNETQTIKELRHQKEEIRVSHQQRKHIREQIKRSNANKDDQIMIHHPGQNCPAQYLTFWDAFRARQLHILWFVEYCHSTCIILFSVQVIHTCAQVIDKDHSFCNANLIAFLVAGCLAPLFGLLNDYGGIRCNTALCMLATALVSFGIAFFATFSSQYKLWYLIAFNILYNWQQTTSSYGCGRLFGIKCGLFAFGYLKTATVMAVLTMVPVLMYGKCFISETCDDSISLGVSILLLCGCGASLFLNPKPLVMEDSNQFQKPVEQYMFVSTHHEIQF